MSNGPEFFQTRMGQTFYDGTMRRIADALTRIANALEAQHPPRVAPQDAAFLDHLQNTLSGKVWDADTLEAVATILRDSGRPIEEPR